MKTAQALALALLAIVGGVSPSAAYLEQSAMGARGIALGGAVLADAPDVTASYWNPAELSRLSAPEVFGEFSQPYGITGLLESSVAAGGPVRGMGVAMACHRLGISNVYAEDVITLAAGREIPGMPSRHRLRVGAAVKLLRVGFQAYSDPVTSATIDFGSASNASADLGATWSTPWRLDIAWVARNLNSPRVKVLDDSEGQRIDMRQDFAATLHWNAQSSLTMGWSPNVERDRRSVNVGLEVWFFDVFALRSGLTNITQIVSSNGSPNDFQFNGGFGLRHRGVRIDAAAFTNHDLGASYRASLLIPLRLGGTR